jgi:uncharacterized protein (DUF2062 family)
VKGLKRWFQEHSLKLLALRDTPEAIAGGIAIGIFFGFTPLFGLKNLLAILFAWLTRSNIIAAVIAGAFHDIMIPLMPAVYLWEYDLGFWLMSKPHRWPTLTKLHWTGEFRQHWRMLFTVGKPILLGSVVCSAPISLISFFVTRGIVARHHRKRDAAANPESP